MVATKQKLVTFVFLIILQSVFNGSIACADDPVCGNRICEVGESQDSCTLDCMIAPLDKDIKIFFPVYNLDNATHYNLDGTKDPVIKGYENLKNFLLSHLDLSITGRIRENYCDVNYIGNITNDIPSIIYIDAASLPGYLLDYPTHYWYPYYYEIDQHESWFTHQAGQPMTRENRLIDNYYITSQLYNTDNSTLRTYFTSMTSDFVNNVPEDNETNGLDGVFYDDTSGHLYTNRLRWKQPITDEEHEAVGNSQYSAVTVNNAIFTNNPVIVKNRDNETEYENIGIWPGGWSGHNGIIYFDAGVLSAGTEVTVDYFTLANATIDPSDLSDNWQSNMIAMLETTRQEIPGKLIIYNGFSTTYNYDDAFLQYADGVMLETFVPATITEAAWQSQMAKLNHFSNDLGKIALPLTYVDDTAPATVMHKSAMFSFTSFLLGKGDLSYFSVAFNSGGSHNFIYFDYWKTDIGDPAETYHVRENINGSNIYEREFAKALVLVNPSDNNTTRTVSLGAEFVKLDNSHITSVDLSSKSGILLKKILPEVCDGIDNDYDGQIDEGVKTTYYRDTDVDGYGDHDNSTQACNAPSGYVSNNTDCNDNDNTKYQLLNGYVDTDNDGYGSGSQQNVCSGASLPSGYSTNNTDNCPTTPNGPLAGTCYNYYTKQSWGSCTEQEYSECGDPPVWYKWCDTFQNDIDEDGTGDVCDPE